MDKPENSDEEIRIILSGTVLAIAAATITYIKVIKNYPDTALFFSLFILLAFFLGVYLIFMTIAYTPTSSPIGLTIKKIFKSLADYYYLIGTFLTVLFGGFAALIILANRLNDPVAIILFIAATISAITLLISYLVTTRKKQYREYI